MEITGSLDINGDIVGGTIIADETLLITSSIVSASYAVTASDAINVASSLGYVNQNNVYYINNTTSDIEYLYTASADVTFVKVEIWGGGGGGGGGRNITNTNYSGAGSGGGGGGYSRRFYAKKDFPDGLKLTVGKAGDGGSTSNATAGGTTSVEVTGSNPSSIVKMQATGGNAGLTSYALITSMEGALQVIGGASGTGTGGSVNLKGGPGEPSVYQDSQRCAKGGSGGTAPYSTTIRGFGFTSGESGTSQISDAGFDFSVASNAAWRYSAGYLTNPGVGGGGGSSRGNAARSGYGSPGGPGVVKITEYK